MILMNDFLAEPEQLKSAVTARLSAAVQSGWYILGKEVDGFENEWASVCGSDYAIGVANGMDAIDQESFSSDEIKSLGPIWTANGISAGTAILYDYRLIHRASPVKNKYHKRLSLFGQFSSSNMPTGEPIALLAEDLKNISQKQASVLNFGINWHPRRQSRF